MAVRVSAALLGIDESIGREGITTSAEVATQERVLASDWGGGRSQFAVGWPKLMMWLFLIQDTLTFAGFLTGYGVVRLASGRWPVQGEIFNLYLVGFMTFFLICSSVTMVLALSAIRRGRQRSMRLYLMATALLGLLFLAGQAIEFIEEREQLRLNFKI